MKKTEYLKLALRNNCHYTKAWIISAFAIIKEDADKYKSDSYIGRLVQEPWGPWGYSFINVDNELEKIEDSVKNEPLFKFKDRVTVDRNWEINITEPVETCIGNILFNAISIVPSFGDKLPFLTGKLNVSKIEDMIAPKLASTPAEDTTRDTRLFYVDEYIKFVDSLDYLKSFTQLCTYAATPKALTPPTGITEFKASLLEKYKGKLNDPVELSRFEAELLAFDTDYLKDDPGQGTFIKDKIKNIARKKLFLTLGADANFTDSLEVTPVINSLEEGWPTDPVQFTAMMNGLRVGSFSRGSETIKGGVSAKILLRAANNYKIVSTDCKSLLGIHRNFNATNINKLIGRYIIEGNKLIPVTDKDIASKYIDKDIIVRSPMFCKLEGENICSICAGDNLSRLPTGLTIPLTEISGTILNTSLKAMHGKVLATTHMELDKVFS